MALSSVIYELLLISCARRQWPDEMKPIAGSAAAPLSPGLSTYFRVMIHGFPETKAEPTPDIHTPHPHPLPPPPAALLVWEVGRSRRGLPHFPLEHWGLADMVWVPAVWPPGSITIS